MFGCFLEKGGYDKIASNENAETVNAYINLTKNGLAATKVLGFLMGAGK